MKPLILQVIWTFGRAGAERMVLELSRGLQKKGYRVAVIAAGGGGEMQKEFESAGIKAVAGPVVDSWNRKKTMDFIQKHIENWKPSLVHAHLSEIWVARAIEKLKKPVPWVLTAHNDDRDDPWLRHKARGWGFRRANRVACVSKAVASYVKREFRVKEERLQVIPNGIDLEKVIPREDRPFHRAPKLITVGRLAPQKDQATLLRALALVKAPWELEIIGDGPEKDALKKLAKQLKIQDRVTFSGIVKDVPKRLAQADLFCFPSLWEGQGIALLEAAVAGLPVLATDLPVFHEWFDVHSMTFAKAHDPKAWAEKIKHVLLFPEKSRAQAKRAKMIVKEKGGVEKMVKAYELFYRRVKKV